MAAISTAGCVLFFSATALFAQAPPAAAPGSAANAKAGHVRLWNMIFFNPVGLDLVASGGPAAKVVQTAPTGNFAAVYDSLMPGRYSLTVFRAGDRQTPLKTFDVPLTDHSYFSILVLQLPGAQQPTFELINDTPDPTKPPANRITVRQVALNTHAIVVTAQNQHTEPLEPGSTQTLEGLPDGMLSVSARSTAGPNQKNWNSDVDFHAARHATVFVVADSYNRLRLRTTTSGPSPAEEMEVAKARP